MDTSTFPDNVQHLPRSEEVLTLALQVWEPSTAATWFESPNGFLDRARPIDVWLLRGPDDVIDALQATMAGAYA